MIAQASRSWLGDRFDEPAAPGSVLVHAPSFAFQCPGGGENQLIQTSRRLDLLGVPVRLFSAWSDRLADARLLHLYGMSREGLELAKVARSLGVPVVLSPICWFEPGALVALARGRLRGGVALAKWAVRRASPRLPGWRRELLGLADAVLPNSRAEASQLGNLFGTRAAKVRVVPNGVDPRFAEASPDLFREVFGASQFVLYAGRIEPRKNVHSLAKAASLARLPLVAIGSPVPGHEPYFEACRREGGTLASWLPRLDADDPLLGSAMAAARVFALPSWFETPGLAALEAAAAGCAVVVTPKGCTREYFGERVVYAKPNDPRGIARALRRAWEDGPPPGLADHVVEQFAWSRVAEITREVYDRVAP